VINRISRLLAPEHSESIYTVYVLKVVFSGNRRREDFILTIPRCARSIKHDISWIFHDTRIFKYILLPGNTYQVLAGRARD